MSGEYSSRNRRMLKKLLPYYKKYSGLFALDMFCSALTTVCEIALPLIVRQITDRAAHDIHDLTAELIIKIVGFYILLRIIDTAANYYTASGGHIMGARIETDMRNDLFSHLQDMSYSFYDDTKIGQLMSRITNDLFDITELSHHGPENVLMTVIKIIAGFIMFASMNIWLAVIVFSLLPLMMLLTSRSRRKMRAAFKQQRREIGEINARTEDSLLGIRVVKSFANEDIEREKFNEGSRRFFKSKQNGYRYMAIFHCTVRLCDGLMYIAIVGIGAAFMMKGKTTVGDFSASLLMVSTLLSAIRTIVEFSEQFNRGMTGIERFTEIMDEVSDIKDSPDAKPIENVRGDIEFRNVTFSYKGTDKKILSDFSLHIAPGENVALVGPSGGGKTTLFNVLSGISKPDSGRVLLNGNDITGKPGSVSYMLQKDLLLPYRKVIDNVTLPLVINKVSKKEAREQAEPLFKTFGLDGTQYKYPSQLSGGMRQRAALLRTYLSSNGVALLDEPFSALDTITKAVIHKWYLDVMQSIDLSTVFITHDIDEAILLSDRIYILADGVCSNEIKIDCPKPRTADFNLTDEFLNYKRQIVEILHLL